VLLAVAACKAAPQPQPPSGASPAPRQVESVAELRGQPAPAFSVEAADGAGTVVVPGSKVTVVMFFGGWSSGSSKGLSALQVLQQRYASSGLEIVAISMDETRQAGVDFARSRGATFRVGWDSWGQRVALRWAQNPYYPNTVFVVDRRGVVRFVHAGGKDGCRADDPIVDDEIGRLLAEAR
jgi:peroxiredoxin